MGSVDCTVDSHGLTQNKVGNTISHMSHLGLLRSAMKLLSWISAVVLTVVVAAAEPPTELVIKTTYLPAECPAKAKKGDQIQVHYVHHSQRLVRLSDISIDWHSFLQRKQV